MTYGPSPSIEVGDLHAIGDDEACALVDKHFGDSTTWRPELLRWRLEHESQRDWKAEVGHWLHTAERLGYLKPLLTRVSRARRVHKRFAGQRHPNEKSHLDLMAELAPAMATHYLTGTGWGFKAWDPKSDLGDVDVELVAPSGQPTVLQVKAPDQPGVVSGRRIVEGEDDARVLAAIEHGRGQLDGARCPSLVVVSAQRLSPVAAHPDFVASRFVGRTITVSGLDLLARDDLGCFFCPAWRSIGAIVLLDHVRGLERLLYTCTVLLNPAADPPVTCAPEWFPRARVCWSDGEQIIWQSGPPVGERYAASRIVDPWWRPDRRGFAFRS
jgi:hypothetical protein